ncbi:hypothetical protein EVAR_55300_1 [Eumeta japonica]|uniref:Ig-like domain-containing protein n=1 Tax=Eumeta variegata TaxID=151549 RepID=A0A4C1ZEQ5_EUMVA|nr:hypothetical protein EVAR_55300_1 [Eumeta japonica]
MVFAVPMTQVVAVAGEPAYLPCDISTQDEEDAVLLVLWYREDLGTPIYSVDARERDFGVAERWSDESVFASRAYFLPERRPAELAVDRVRATDQGLYRCRVDFKQAQTRNSRVNLTVVVLLNARLVCKHGLGPRVAAPRDEFEFCPTLRPLKKISSHLPTNDI